MSRYIWIKGERYYYYNTYTNWQEAYYEAKRHKKENKKNKYYILITEQGLLNPYKKYHLYMTRVFTL